MNDRYMRRSGESEYEYGLRLIEIKMEQKPDDLDWEDIVELTGMDCHRDSLRKAASVTPYSGYAVAQHYKKLMASKAEGESYTQELDGKIRELRRESQKYYDQRREYHKLVSRDGRRENLEDRLVEAARALNTEKSLSRMSDVRAFSDDEAVIVFTDWHYGMTTDNVWDRYDTQECVRRVNRVVSEARRRLSLHRCRRLHVLILGDMAHGAIHVGARVASEELVCDQLMRVSELLAEAIAQLADEVEMTVVHATYGNHMRTVQKKEESLHADNMERLIPWWLKQRFGGRDDIVVDDDPMHEFIVFEAVGRGVCATHGDLDCVRGSGKTIHTLLNKRHKLDVDYVILADKHHREDFDEVGVLSLVAPSLCGADDHANSKRLYSSPGQILLIFDRYGGSDAYYYISVGERDE